MKYLWLYIKMFRVKQWLKNCIVFLPALMHPSLLSFDSIVYLFATFIFFCVGASMVYIVNDWIDRDADAKHHIKKLRPFASGELILKDALIAFVLLASIFVFLCIYFVSFSQGLVFLMFLYLFQSFLYSFYLKNITLLEMLIVSTGYCYRTYAGGLSIDLPTSVWMLATIFLASIFMVAQKRLSDINSSEDINNLRTSIRLYPDGFLNLITGIAASSAIVSFILFTLSDYAEDRFQNQYLPLTSLFIIYATFRYIQIAMTSMKGHDPIELILKDRHLKLCIILCIFFILFSSFI